MRFLKSCIFIVGAFIGNTTWAADKPISMKLCYEDQDIYPWVLKEKPGLNIVLLNAVEKKLGVKLEMAPLPWKRCLEELKHGEVDGVFAASFKADRVEIAVYPMVGEKVDDTRALHMDGYTLYRLKGSSTQWDGKKLTVSGSIGAQPGYSIIDFLKSQGVKVDDGARSADDNLRKLAMGRVDAVALQTLEGDNSLQANPDLASKIEAVSPVLVNKPYFLILSRQFFAKYPEFSKNIWSGIANVRESTDYKAKAASFK